MTTPGFTAEHALAARRAVDSPTPRAAVRSEPPAERVFSQAIHWGSYAAECYGVGVKKYSAILWDIPWGQSWETTCAATPGNPGGISPRVPDRCVNTGLNEWGEWYVPDNSCCIFANCYCTGYHGGLVYCEQQCPSGNSWMAVGTC